ncbi:MAG: alpha/beta fold hydrolase [Rhizomicrobium sp.]
MAREDGETIAYLRRAGKPPGILWLGGFKSGMTATKGTALDSWAAARGRSLLRFDYFGHGQSSGNFREGTITRWRDDALAVLDGLTMGPQILVGSSMGAWIALLAAHARPERIKAMLLIAPATDFTEAIMWARFPPEIRAEIMEQGEWLWPSVYDTEPYPITRALVEDGRRHLLLGSPIRLDFPVRILQGMKDPDVPWQHAVKLADTIEGDVALTLLKHGDHRLSTPAELARLTGMLDALAEAREGA